MKNNQAQLYMETLVLEALLANPSLTKTAEGGIIESIVEKVKSMVGSHINPDDKLGSALDIVLPGFLWASGFRIIAIIVEIAESWFGIKISNILKEVSAEIKSLASGKSSLHSSDVATVVQNSVQNNLGSEPNQEQFQFAQTHPLTTFNSLSLNQAHLYKLSLLHIQEHELLKTAGILSTLGRFIGLRSYTASALAGVIKWVVIAILAALGLLAVDDAAHKFVSVPSQTQYTPSTPSSFTPSTSQNIPLVTSTQTVFKPNPNYQEEKFGATKHWIEPTPPSQIGNQIILWTHQIYPDTQSLTDEIKNTSGFNQVLQDINQYNSNNTLDVTFMPSAFTSRKSVVDMFMDELAQKSPPSQSSPQTTSKPHLSQPM